MPFRPKFSITPEIAFALMRIEAAREAVTHLPITPTLLATLRETAHLYSTHYSTQIEGNRLTQEQVSQVLKHHHRVPGREHDEKEVLGYYAALEKVEQLALSQEPVSEHHIQLLHGIVMGGGKRVAKPTPYRDGQNVIRDSRSRAIVCMPPQAKDVPSLMNELINWLQTSARTEFPCPLRAAIAHYQFATIHPYYDGNGRTARLLTTLILHLGGYGLKGLYSLEEYYARNLLAYYEALNVGPSHNYYSGRATSDITPWITYFCQGAADSFETVRSRAQAAADASAGDHSQQLRTLDPRQRLALNLFRASATITSRDLEALLAISQRTARHLLAQWVAAGFVIITHPARKNRQYALAAAFQSLLH
jgi:Fic family protein